MAHYKQNGDFKKKHLCNISNHIYQDNSKRTKSNKMNNIEILDKLKGSPLKNCFSRRNQIASFDWLKKKRFHFFYRCQHKYTLRRFKLEKLFMLERKSLERINILMRCIFKSV